MKNDLIHFSQQYLATLKKHVKLAPRGSLMPALKLGRRAVALGLDTLDLARIHEQAVTALKLARNTNAPADPAGVFFTEANTAIEETHRTARLTKIELGKLTATLSRRTEELTVSNRQLQKGNVRRKTMEDDFAKRGEHHQKRLEESLKLQNHLRHLTHQVLAAQEDERKMISRKLQDEILQTLMGINVRLLCMKQQARSKTNGLQNTIASTQRLVANSAKSMRQAGRKIGGI
jgi:signal transduction histidine kinase